MVKLKMNLFFIFSLSCLTVVVFGSSKSNSAANPNLSHVLESLKTQERRIRELEKSREEWKEQVESLKKEVEELKQKVREDHDLWILTPPLRGPPGPKGDRGFTDPRSLQNCRDVMEFLPSSRAKKQWIYPEGSNKKVEAHCDFDKDGGGWTVIQKRSSGPDLDFNRNWTDYVNGFQTPTGNLWLGLKNIHTLTKNGDQELRIELQDFQGNKAYAKYKDFSISDASDFYRLSISGYYGNSTAGDSFLNPGDSGLVNNGMRFTTFDRDNDRSPNGNCGVWYHSGWWFNYCGAESNLNGKYRDNGAVELPSKGIIWKTWKGREYSLAKTEMKIRTRKDE